MPESSDNENLNRTLGLPAALSVGIGTMLGAGIFVFPGFAANEAGPAAKTIAVLGSVCCLGLLFFMETVALVISGGVLLAAVAWYFIYRTGEQSGTSDAMP